MTLNKTLLTFIFICSVIFTNAQTVVTDAGKVSASEFSIMVADVDVNSLEGLEYIEIVGQQKVLNPFKFKIFVEYGQKNFTFKEQSIRDVSRGEFGNGTGLRMKFNGMIDALNFFNERGWNYVNQYVVTIGQQNVYHILLRREK